MCDGMARAYLHNFISDGEQHIARHGASVAAGHLEVRRAGTAAVAVQSDRRPMRYRGDRLQISSCC